MLIQIIVQSVQIKCVLLAYLITTYIIILCANTTATSQMDII